LLIFAVPVGKISAFMPTLRELFPDAQPVPTEPHLRAADMVAASRQARRVLNLMCEQRIPIGNNLFVDDEHVKAWPAPWFVRPVEKVELQGPLVSPEGERCVGSVDYESQTGLLDHIYDVSCRMHEVLSSHAKLRIPLEKMGIGVKIDDANRLIVMVATETVRQSIGIQVGAMISGNLITTDSIVKSIEASLRFMNQDVDRVKRPLFVASPLSPLWSDHKAVRNQSVQNYPFCLLGGTVPEKNIASHLLSSIPATETQPALKRLPLLLETAVPELLVPQRGSIDFLYGDERAQLKALLEGHDVFTDDLRKQCVTILADMLASLPELSDSRYEDSIRVEQARWLSEKSGQEIQSEMLPAPFDAQAPRAIAAYVDPLLAALEQGGDTAVLPLLKKRLPLIAGIIARRIMELSEESVTSEERDQFMHELPILYGYADRIARLFGGNLGAIQGIPQLLADAHLVKYTNKLKTSI
jgi:hypothetical protein